MKRLKFAFLFALLVAIPVAAQTDLSKVEIKTTLVAGSVYMLEGAGGNIGLSVGDDGVVMIDDQYAPLAPKIKEAIAKITSKPVRFVLNTHFHGDHTGGNETFGETAPLIAHHNVRKRLEAGVGREKNPVSPAALPIITFGEDLTVFLNGEEVRAVHYGPGHTDGDSVIYFTKSNVVHMGDNFFSGRFPFIDLDSGGSVQGVIDSVEKTLAAVPATAKVIPGHGPLASMADLRAYANSLKEMSALVRAAVRGGKTLQQMKEEKILAKWENLSWTFISTEKFIDTLHRDATMGREGLTHKH
jgi:cyclase